MISADLVESLSVAVAIELVGEDESVGKVTGSVPVEVAGAELVGEEEAVTWLRTFVTDAATAHHPDPNTEPYDKA